jgi:hypothetical protein
MYEFRLVTGFIRHFTFNYIITLLFHNLLYHVQCHYYCHNATKSHILVYILLFLSQHVSHLQVLALTPKLLHCIE